MLDEKRKRQNGPVSCQPPFNYLQSLCSRIRNSHKHTDMQVSFCVLGSLTFTSAKSVLCDQKPVTYPTTCPVCSMANRLQSRLCYFKLLQEAAPSLLCPIKGHPVRILHIHDIFHFRLNSTDPDEKSKTFLLCGQQYILCYLIKQIRISDMHSVKNLRIFRDLADYKLIALDFKM